MKEFAKNLGELNSDLKELLDTKIPTVQEHIEKIGLYIQNQEEVEKENFIGEHKEELYKIHEQQTNLPDDDLVDDFEEWAGNTPLEVLKTLL